MKRKEIAKTVLFWGSVAILPGGGLLLLYKFYKDKQERTKKKLEEKCTDSET